MIKSRLLQVMVGVCLLFLGGCIMPREVYYLPPEGKISVEGDKIYLNNELYAELRYAGSYYAELRKDGLNKDNPDYTGFAMYYYPYDKEEWIFPKQGLGYYIVEEKKKYSTVAEMDKLDRTAKERGYTYHSKVTGFDFLDTDKVFPMIGDKKFVPIEKSPTPTAFDIQISEDGKYVYYEVKNGRDGIYKYRVRYEDCFTQKR